MAVNGFVFRAVADDDDVAVPPLTSHEFDTTIASGVHRRTDRSRIIGAHVRAHAVEDRMPAVQAEPRADAGEVHRRADERLAQRLTGGRVVGTGAIGGHVTHRAVDVSL